MAAATRLVKVVWWVRADSWAVCLLSGCRAEAQCEPLTKLQKFHDVFEQLQIRKAAGRKDRLVLVT